MDFIEFFRPLSTAYAFNLIKIQSSKMDNSNPNEIQSVSGAF